MKRVKDGDIKIKYSDFRGITPNFRIRFYTTNSNYYIEKTSIDLLWDEEDEETSYVKLNWTELQAIGRGVMNYSMMTFENDDDFDDGIYDHYYQRTTDYFIDTDIIIDDEQPDKTISELIAEVDQKVDAEITRSTQKDEEIDDAIANLQEEIDNIDVDVDLSDYYTKEEVDEMEHVISTALNDLNTRINEIDLSNYYTKAEIDAMIGNIETLLSQI